MHDVLYIHTTVVTRSVGNRRRLLCFISVERSALPIHLTRCDGGTDTRPLPRRRVGARYRPAQIGIDAGQSIAVGSWAGLGSSMVRDRGEHRGEVSVQIGLCLGRDRAGTWLVVLLVVVAWIVHKDLRHSERRDHAHPAALLAVNLAAELA